MTEQLKHDEAMNIIYGVDPGRGQDEALLMWSLMQVLQKINAKFGNRRLNMIIDEAIDNLDKLTSDFYGKKD